MKFTEAIVKAFDAGTTLESDRETKSRLQLAPINNILAAEAGRLCEERPGTIFRLQQQMENWFKTANTHARSTLMVFAISKHSVESMDEMRDQLRSENKTPYRKVLALSIRVTPPKTGLGPDENVEYVLRDITDEYYRLKVTAD